MNNTKVVLSVLALAEQYLAFIEAARKLRLELAADYLVMAAWLAYLKSRLLLPEPEQPEPEAQDMAAALAYQLRRLEAMRDAGVSIESLIQRGVAADGSVIVAIEQEQVGSPADVQAKVDALKKAGKKTALLLVATAEGDMLFVALPIL